MASIDYSEEGLKAWRLEGLREVKAWRLRGVQA
jgi:hypothetical protein